MDGYINIYPAYFYLCFLFSLRERERERERDRLVLAKDLLLYVVLGSRAAPTSTLAIALLPYYMAEIG